MNEELHVIKEVANGLGDYDQIHHGSLGSPRTDIYRIHLRKDRHRFTRVYLRFSNGKLSISIENWPVSERKEFTLGDPNVSIESMREYIMSIADMTHCQSDRILEGF